ncbi:MAG: LysM peptidoglycan-binding domain-containing protein [Bacilli bacterium]|nr:LysM peptidoglycan-binding domain-containing protein [Bacilli bacterium]
MKKNISFEKKIEFPTMIGEICAISLEQDLKFLDESTIEGDLLLTGRYKLTEASRMEEDFHYKIPTEISLTEKLDISTSKIEISDFTYEIENENMICHIELLLEGLEKIEEKEEQEERECDGDLLEEVVEEKEEKMEEIPEKKNEETKDLFLNLEDDKDTYGTFVVYMVRQNESIHEIIEKYHTSMEEVEKYNNLKEISIGSKLIIPLLHD